ncbi:MAG: hypothetical protein H0W59_03630 [Chloroflexia bacterium]|jgi:F0F1-type ATP synthase assembly protein I|nr:hypothetical protein [Chloroflexia bacterium]
MTEKEVLGSAHLRSGDSEFRESRAEGTQELSLAHAELDLKSVTAEREHQLKRFRVESQIEEERKENERRRARERVLFYVVVFLMVAGLIVGVLLATSAQNAETRRFGQGIVTLILGAVAGYFTGRAGK